MISYSLWQQRYSADPAIVGRTIRIVDAPGTIVGVMPEGMHFPFNADVWIPTGTMPPAIQAQPRQARGYFAVGRLADGVAVDQARAELRSIGARLAEQYPETNRDLWPSADPFVERVFGPQFSRLFWALMGAVGFVLLIACSNVANLLLARAAGRTGEVSVRVAVGASRWQVVRQLLIESVLLALAAGGLGLLIALAGLRWFGSEQQNIGLPYWMVFTLDWRTFAFLLGLCVVTGCLFGLAPALHASKTNVHEMLKEGGRTGAHFGGQDPIGRVIRLPRGQPGMAEAEWMTIVGLAPNIRQRNNNQEPDPDPVVYIPHRQNTTMARSAQVIARARSTPDQAIRILREAILAVDPDHALSNPRTMDEALADQRWLLRVFTTMFAVFASIALVLAAVGLYAVTAYAVTQHTRDIGVRMVLGAQPGQVVWLFLRRALVHVAVGLVVGLGAALALGQLLQAFLVQTGARDPVILLVIALVLTSVSVAACIGPARRAARLDPLVALRHE